MGDVDCKLCDKTADKTEMHRIEGEWYCDIHAVLAENRKKRPNA